MTLDSPLPQCVLETDAMHCLRSIVWEGVGAHDFLEQIKMYG
jgi:hypothetical protein